MPDYFINNPVLTPIFEHIKSLVDYTHIGIFYLDGAEVILVTMQGPIHLQHKNLIRFKVSDSYNISLIVSNNTPFLLADIEEDTPYAKHFKADFDQLVGDPYDYVKSWMGFPLESGRRTYGTIEVAHDVRNHYSEKDMEMLHAYIQSVSTQN